MPERQESGRTYVMPTYRSWPKRAVILAAAMLALGGCAAEAKAPTSVTATAPTAGCVKTDTEELYVTELYDCAARGTKVYLFNTSTARDSYRKVAEEFGSIVVGEGETWLEVKA